MGLDFRIVLVVLFICYMDGSTAQNNTKQIIAPRASEHGLSTTGNTTKHDLTKMEDSGKILKKTNEISTNTTMNKNLKSSSEENPISFISGSKPINKDGSGSENELNSNSIISTVQIETDLTNGGQKDSELTEDGLNENSSKEILTILVGDKDSELSSVNDDAVFYGPPLSKFHVNSLRTLCVITSACLVGAIYYVTRIIFSRRSRNCGRYSPVHLGPQEQTTQFKHEV